MSLILGWVVGGRRRVALFSDGTWLVQPADPALQLHLARRYRLCEHASPAWGVRGARLLQVAAEEMGGRVVLPNRKQAEGEVAY